MNINLTGAENDCIYNQNEKCGRGHGRCTFTQIGVWCCSDYYPQGLSEHAAWYISEVCKRLKDGPKPLEKTK